MQTLYHRKQFIFYFKFKQLKVYILILSTYWLWIKKIMAKIRHC